ncbi:MAG: ABC transporter substrate-binding protein [Clostridia bacterium]
MKKTIALILCVCMLLTFGCKKEEAVVTRVAALKGPTGMGLAYMMQDGSERYQIDLYDAPDAVIGKFINGEIDIAAVPINLASTLYNKTAGNTVMIAVNTLGVLYVLENGDTIQTIGDLAGKNIYATGQGSTPEYVLNYLLEKNGLTDVNVTYVGEHAALATMLASGEANIGMLPEPNVTVVQLKNEKTRIALDLNTEWEAVTGQKLVQGCYIANKAFYDAHPQTIAQFITDCGSSVEKVNMQADSAKIIADLSILPSEAIAAKAIPSCNIVCVTGDEMKTMASAMLEILFQANPKSIGGKLPDDALYAK